MRRGIGRFCLPVARLGARLVGLCTTFLHIFICTWCIYGKDKYSKLHIAIREGDEGERTQSRAAGNRLERGQTCKAPRTTSATSVGKLFEAARTSGVGRRSEGDLRAWAAGERGLIEGSGSSQDMRRGVRAREKRMKTRDNEEVRDEMS
jgi:hypothetical protein